MTPDEIAARLVVLETFAMMALGLYLANSRNDPTYEKAGALIDHLVSGAKDQAGVLSPAGQAAAKLYAEHLAETLRQNLRQMRGEGGQVQ